MDAKVAATRKNESGDTPPPLQSVNGTVIHS
jgi:hypothetical protein